MSAPRFPSKTGPSPTNTTRRLVAMIPLLFAIACGDDGERTPEAECGNGGAGGGGYQGGDGGGANNGGAGRGGASSVSGDDPFGESGVNTGHGSVRIRLIP